MLEFGPNTRLNQSMHSCRSSHALPGICRNKTIQKAHSSAASCLKPQQSPALSDRQHNPTLAQSPSQAIFQEMRTTDPSRLNLQVHLLEPALQLEVGAFFVQVLLLVPLMHAIRSPQESKKAW